MEKKKIIDDVEYAFEHGLHYNPVIFVRKPLRVTVDMSKHADGDCIYAEEYTEKQRKHFEKVRLIIVADFYSDLKEAKDIAAAKKETK